MNIRLEATRFAEAVVRFVERVRAFYYEAVLCGRNCPRCDSSLQMIAEGRCRCTGQGHRFDPTLAFQSCIACNGKARLQVRRYVCRDCDQPIESRFRFDTLIFDAAYFRRKMAEHRQRQTERREHVREMLAGSRSEPIQADGADLSSIPGLVDALNGLTAGAFEAFLHQPRSAFDLNRYQGHIRAHICEVSVVFEDIPPLSENTRLDRIWRFVALIFLAHAGSIRLEQDGGTIMIYEAHPERQGIPGDLEAVDGIEGSAG